MFDMCNSLAYGETFKIDGGRITKEDGLREAKYESFNCK